MNRRGFLAGMLATAAGLLLPYEPERVYSFPARRIVRPGEFTITSIDRDAGTITTSNLGDIYKHLYPDGLSEMICRDSPMMAWLPR